MSASPPAFNPAILGALMDPDEPEEGRAMVADLQQIFAENFALRLTELPDLLSGGQTEALRSLFHQLKGGSASLGYDALSAYCAEEEKKARENIPNDPGAPARLTALHEEARSAVEATLGPASS